MYNAAGLILSTIFSSFTTWAPAPASVSNGYFAVFLYLNDIWTYIVHLLADLDRFMPSLDSSDPSVEKKCDQFLCDVVNTGCESGCIIMLRSSSGLVTSTCSSRGQMICRSWGTDSGSIANSRRRRPVWKRNVFSSGHLSRKPYRTLLEITLQMFFNIKKGRIQIPLSTSRDQFLAVPPTTSGPCRVRPASKRASGCFIETKLTACCDNT